MRRRERAEGFRRKMIKVDFRILTDYHAPVRFLPRLNRNS
jgi:hypothetical protein